MTNAIGVVWTSNSRQLFEDMAKRVAAMEKETEKWKGLAQEGKKAGDVVGTSYKEQTQAISNLGRIAETSFKRTIAPMDAHLQRLKEHRVLMRMGKIDAEQFARANATSLKTMYGDTGALDRLRQMKKGHDEITESVSATTGALGEQSSVMDSIGTRVAGTVLGWVSVRSAIQLAGIELQNIKDRQREAADSQVGHGQRLFDIAQNYGEMDDKGELLTKLDARIRGIMRKTGASLGSVDETLSYALASRSGGSVQDAESATEIAVGLSDKPEDQRALAKSMLSWKARNSGMSFESIAGMQIKAREIHPSATAEQFGTHVAPFIAQSKLYGDDLQTASALFGTIAGQVDDTEARISTNAGIAFQVQLAELMPEIKGGTLGRMRHLQTAEGKHIRQKLLGALDKDGIAGMSAKSTLDGERKTFATVVNLANADPETMTLFNRNLNEMGGDAGFFEKKLSGLQNLRSTHPLMVPAQLDRRTKSDVELEKLADPQAAGGITREYLANRFKATGDTAVAQFLQGGEFELKSNIGRDRPVARMAEMLGRKADDLETPHRHQGNGSDNLMNSYLWEPMFGAMLGTDMRRMDNPTDRDREAAARIRAIITELMPVIRQESESSRSGRGRERNDGVSPAPVVNVSVVMPGQGEKAPPVPASGTQWGF